MALIPRPRAPRPVAAPQVPKATASQTKYRNIDASIPDKALSTYDGIRRALK